MKKMTIGLLVLGLILGVMTSGNLFADPGELVGTGTDLLADPGDMIGTGFDSNELT